MSQVGNERLKLTAAWLNTLASASLVVGVLGPAAAAVYGVNAAAVSAATLGTGMVAWFLIGTGLHWCARYVLKGLRP